MSWWRKGLFAKPAAAVRSFSAGAVSEPLDAHVSVDGRAVPLRVRRSPRARRIVLRLDAARDEAVLTLPRRASVDEGLAFVRERQDWIAARIAALPPRIPFADGAAVPLFGIPHLVRHDPELEGRVVAVEDGVIRVAGRPEHLARRLGDWLRAEAKRALAPVVREKASRLGLEAGRVTVREVRTLWGSCSAKGDVSLCWRLVLAPSAVADYVCAHEAAHLRVRGHGPRFWRLVEELASDMTGARAWLAANGESLYRYGP